MTLEEAAKQIDISKKTLDDYHSQIRLAEQYGFDFDNHLDCKMGVLRKFVRERHKKKAEYHFDILDKVFRPFSEEGLSDEEKDYK